MEAESQGIAVFGTSGYLGGLLARHLTVQKLARQDRIAKNNTRLVVDASFPPTRSSKVVWRQYFEAISRRVAQAQVSNINYVYLGSMSSIGMRRSRYGERKHLSEQSVLSSGGIVLRLGLVVGEVPMGRFGTLAENLEGFPIVPIPHESTFPLFLTPEEGFLRSIRLLLRDVPSTSNELISIDTTLSTLSAAIHSLQERNLITKREFRLNARASKILQNLSSQLHIGSLDSLSSLALIGRYGWDGSRAYKLDDLKVDDGSKIRLQQF